MDEKGEKWINFGEIEVKDEYYHMSGYSRWSEQKTNKNGKVEAKTGCFYSRVWYEDRELEKVLEYSKAEHLLKTRKRFVEFTDEVIEMKPEHTLTSLREVDRTIKFLDYRKEK